MNMASHESYRQLPRCNGAHPVTFSVEDKKVEGLFDRMLSRVNNFFPRNFLPGLASPSWQSARVSEIRQRLVLK